MKQNIESLDPHHHSLAENGMPAAYPIDKTLHQLFAAQVLKTPHNIAVICQERRLTYQELDEQANRLAHYLQKYGAAPDTLIAVCLDRSAEMIVTLLAILKAGAAYLPLDPVYPSERLTFMLEDAGVSLVISHSELIRHHALLTTGQLTIICLDTNRPVISLEDSNAPSNQAGSGNLAYCLYTSGSTGRPKGVLIEHRNVVSLLVNDRLPFDFTQDDVWTMFHSYGFDFSVWEMYGALLYGGSLLLVPKETAQDPAAFLDLVIRQHVTILNQTPSFFYLFMQTTLSAKLEPLRLRYIIFGGEALNIGRLKVWQQAYPQITLVNMYGITETTVHVTYKEITPKDIELEISNIGRSLPTATAYIMDAEMRLLPEGEPGEIYVGGAGMGRGYLGQEELTRQKFVSNPYCPGERLYRSGDLARLLPTGEMEYLGRIDKQVQIRGFRVELGEIQNRLLQHPDVTQAALRVPTLSSGKTEIVAYVVSNGQATTTDLRSFLAQTLPNYMLPTIFINLPALPLTLNGKIDYGALPPPPPVRPQLGTAFVAPRNQIEMTLAQIWADVLGLAEIGVNDDFFELGGHSLLATQVMSRLRDVFQVDLPVQYLFESPTVADLALNLIAQIMEQIDHNTLVAVLAKKE